MKRLFETSQHAAKYATFRPTYPGALYDKIFQFCSSRNNKFDTAIDVACGSGQSTIPLGQKFKHVLGTDISSSQINNAPTTHENIIFQVGSAENLAMLEYGSVDLLTCAQAVHWLDFTKFINEVNRVLHPKTGVVAVYGYGNVKLDDEYSCSLIWQVPGMCLVSVEAKIWKTLGNYWDSKRKHIDDHYKEFTLPYKDFHRIDDLSMNKMMTMDSFIGYISTWSAYQSYMKEHPEATILEELQEKLKESTKGEESFRVSWPLFILLASKDK